MNTERLVTMANQIGAFFTSQGADREVAVCAIADHLRRFWEPRMRLAISRHVADGGSGLLDEVAEAVRRLPAAHQASAARNDASG